MNMEAITPKGVSWYDPCAALFVFEDKTQKKLTKKQIFSVQYKKFKEKILDEIRGL